MANAKNLVPQAHVLTVDEQSKGGRQSAKKRKEKKLFKDALLLLLDEKIKDRDGNPTKKTYQDAIVSGLVKRSSTGDPRAIELLLRIIGETPEGSNTQDHTLQKAHELLGGIPDALE